MGHWAAIVKKRQWGTADIVRARVSRRAVASERASTNDDLFLGLELSLHGV